MRGGNSSVCADHSFEEEEGENTCMAKKENTVPILVPLRKKVLTQQVLFAFTNRKKSPFHVGNSEYTVVAFFCSFLEILHCFQEELEKKQLFCS